MHTMEGIRMHVMIISFSLWQYDLVCDRIKLRIMTYKTFNIRIQENWTPQRVLASYSENFGNVVPRIMILDTFIMPPPPPTSHCWAYRGQPYKRQWFECFSSQHSYSLETIQIGKSIYVHWCTVWKDTCWLSSFHIYADIKEASLRSFGNFTSELHYKFAK